MNVDQKMDTGRRFVAIGVGNADCGDDGVGPAVIDRLASRPPEGMALFRSNGDPAELIGFLEGSDAAILIDALATSRAPGTIRRFDVGDVPLPAEAISNYSTHGLGLNESIELARAMNCLPAKTVVIGIDGARFEPGEEMSPQVSDRIEELATLALGIAKTFNP